MQTQRPIRARPTFLMSLAMVVIGIAMLVRTIAAGGGPLASGVFLGLFFVAAGVGRIYLQRRLR
jgi:hypothetical protein